MASVKIHDIEKKGLLRELNPGPLAPEARIMPLDQAAMICSKTDSHCTEFAHLEK